MSTYIVVKYIHVLSVSLSFLGFFLRGIWMLSDSPMLERRWVKIVPHVNDTVLLTAAVWLAVLMRQYPFVHGWITAKVIGLLFYIGFGMFSLRRGRSKAIRAMFWLASLSTFGYIVSVALSKNPWGFLAML